MFEYREMRSSDIPGVVGLQRLCFPDPFPADLLWSPEHLAQHLEVFPRGQIVAVLAGAVVGSASSLVISERAWEAHLPWEKTTGGFFLSAHDPGGDTLYCADISVHPEHQRQGIGRGLYQMRFGLVRALGLARLGTACRIPGWSAWSAQRGGGSQEDYCADVVAGLVYDKTLPPLLKYGLRFVCVVPDHMEVAESGNAAAALEWTP